MLGFETVGQMKASLPSHPSYLLFHASRKWGLLILAPGYVKHDVIMALIVDDVRSSVRTELHWFTLPQCSYFHREKGGEGHMDQLLRSPRHVPWW